jgi:hypothetical protein
LTQDHHGREVLAFPGFATPGSQHFGLRSFTYPAAKVQMMQSNAPIIITISNP